MYLYFNSNGVLKEIVNDEAIRQSNSGVNKIYFFIEGAEPQVVDGVYQALTFNSGRRTFLDVDGEIVGAQDESFSIQTSEEEIPYDKKRELKWFKYFTKYEMFHIDIPDDVLNYNRTFACRINIVNTDLSILTLGLVVFNIEVTGGDAIISPDTAITIAQWNYLTRNMVTTADLDNEGFRLMIEGIIADNVDNALSLTSEHAVQNKVVTAALNDKLDKLSDNGDYVYTHSGTTQGQIPYSQINTANAIVRRTSGADISVPPIPGDNVAATSKYYVDQAINNLREVAEGKCKTIVISYTTTAPTTDAQAQALTKMDGTGFEDLADFTNYVTYGVYSPYFLNPDFNSQNDSISMADADSSYIITIGGEVLIASEHYGLKTGDIIIVIQTDVPDRWWYPDGDSAYKLETSKVPLEDYYAKNANLIPTTTGFDIGSSSVPFNNIYGETLNAKGTYETVVIKPNGYNGVLGLGLVNSLEWSSSAFWTNVANFDLGKNGHEFRDVYLLRNLTDNTNSYTIAESFGVLFNKIDTSSVSILYWSKMVTILVTSNTTFTFETPKTGTIPEYKAYFTADANVTLTFTGVSKIMCNDDSLTIVEGTDSSITLPNGTSIEVSIIGGNMIAINWDAQ